MNFAWLGENRDIDQQEDLVQHLQERAFKVFHKCEIISPHSPV